RRWMGAVLDMNRRWLNLGMVREIGADEPAIPRPAIFRVARRMDADKTAPRPDVAFKCSLFSIVEDVSGRAQEHHDFVSGQPRIGEASSVLRAVHSELVFSANRRYGGDTLRDRIMAKAGRLREDEDSEPRLGLCRATGGGRRAGNRARDQQRRETLVQPPDTDAIGRHIDHSL